MLEAIVAGLLVAAIVSLLAIARRPIVVSDLKLVPPGVDVGTVQWVSEGSAQSQRKVRIGWFRREYHYRGRGQHMVLVHQREE